MKFAPIVPPGCEDLLPDTERVMAFADIAIANPEYARFYAHRDGVIMDNQIYEGQRGLAPRELAFVLGFVQPSLAIIPDVRGDADATIVRGQEYSKLLRDHLPDSVELCGVVQGVDTTTIVRCLDYWLANDDVSWVAAPIAVPGRLATRDFTYRQYVFQKAVDAKKRVHWLGMERYDEDWLSHSSAYVESLDTAEPTSATIWGATMQEACNVPALLKRPPNFMTWPGYRQILIDRKELLWSNIKWMEGLLAGQVVTPVGSEGWGIREKVSSS